MSDNLNLHALTESLTPLQGCVFDPLADLVIEPLRTNDLLFGGLLGLVDGRRAIQVETARLRAGFPQDERQRILATSLESDSYVFEEMLAIAGEQSILDDPQPQRNWFILILREILKVWDSGKGDPTIEGIEFASAWGHLGETFWTAVQPRGFDTIVFGEAARSRLISRSRAYLRSLAAPNH